MQSHIVQPDLLIIGGDLDPSILRLIIKCGEHKVLFHTCLQGDSGTPNIVFDVHANALLCDNVIIQPKAAFIRHDVFKYLNNNDTQSLKSSTDWFNVFYGWLIANKKIRIFNRPHINKPHINKLTTLLIAREIGMDVPETYVTNTVSFINETVSNGEWIQKPVDGGAHCTGLGVLPAELYPQNRIFRPLIMQPQLNYPEVRVYRIGGSLLAFRVTSTELDYRESDVSIIAKTSIDPQLSDLYLKLCDELGLDFCAADFKTCPKTGKLLLLEVNANPMFARHDSVDNGHLINLILKELIKDS